MRITVVGCGKIGSTILSALAGEGHDVVGIDNSPAVIRELSDLYDVMCVCGNGVDCDTLSEAGTDKADLFIAVTGSDELNMLSCFLAGKMGAGKTIARIRNPEYNDVSLGFMKQQLGIDEAINPELMTSQEMMNILKFPSAVSVETFSGHNFEMIELKLKEDSPLCGASLMELRKKYAAKFLICAVLRDGEVVIPTGNYVLKCGDSVKLTAPKNELQKLMKMLGILQKQARSVMILGASRTAYYLSRMLIAAGNDVKIVEINEERCSEFCNLVPEATVIHGDGASQDLLFEEGIRSTDAFVSLTGIDEENILISIFASTQNVPTVISKVNRSEFLSMAEKLGLDCIVSPKKIMSDVLARYARALSNSLGSGVERLYKIMDGKAEVLEFNVRSDFSALGTPLHDLNLKPNILIAGILRGRHNAIIPTGDDAILAGDRVVVVAAGQRLGDLSDILL